MSAQEFTNMLKARNVPLATLREQIRAQIAWSQVMAQRLRPRIQITQKDVEAEMARLKKNIGKTRYRPAEIFLAVNEQTSDEQARALAKKIAGQLKRNPSAFPRLASQFSNAAGAAQGGDMGWISPGQLSQTLEDTLSDMNKGEISDVIRTNAGYHILLLRDKREITEQSLPSKGQIRQQLGMERLERLQRRYMLDLKATAYIDKRDTRS
jgi:peptidyl-prolyl cis-trans isomerase SurA